MRYTPHWANNRPSAMPPKPTTRFSVSTWRTTLQRPAPRDRRTAISLSLTVLRASCRLATLAQAISSTKATAQKNQRVRASQLARHENAHGNHVHAPTLIGLGIRRSHAAGDSIHLCLRLMDGHTRPEPGGYKERVLTPVATLRIGRHQGDPELGRLGKAESFRHHANDRIGQLINLDFSANYTLIRCKGPLPQPVAKHHLALSAGGVVSRQEGAADVRLFVQRLEEVSAYLGAENPSRFTGTAEVEAAPAPGGHRFE